MHQSTPRFVRLGRNEIMLECAASLLKPSTWFAPSSLEGAVVGERLYWFGPFHVAINPAHVD
jgi:hypothetical protein